MGYVFLSYRKKDAAECLALAAHLREAGFEVWWDEGLPPGTDFFGVLDEKLRGADAVITLWTKNSVRSRWVYFETDLASRMGKLVPLKFDNCEVPIGLNRLQTYDYKKRDRTSAESWQAILRRVREATANGKARHGTVPTLDEITWSKISASRDPKDYRDYLSASPDGLHSAEAHMALKKYSSRNFRTLTFWVILGLTIYFALLTPGIALFLDYGPELALFWAALYFHYFFFDAVFGPMMIAVYLFTLSKGLGYGFRQMVHKTDNAFVARAVCILVLLVAPLLSCGLVTIMETKSGYAPWQFSWRFQNMPVNAFGAQPHDTRTLRDIFQGTRQLPLQSVWDQRNIDPGKKVRCLASIQTDPQSNSACVKAMVELKTAMVTLLKDRTALSLTDHAYVYGFGFAALTFLGTYFNIWYLCVNSQKVRLWMAGLAPWGNQRYSRLLYLFAAQLLFLSVWFVARLLFQMETKTLLPNDSGTASYSEDIRNAYFLFVAVYFVGVGFVVTAAFRLNSALTRLAIVSFALIIAAFLGLSFSVTSFVTTLQTFIGVQARPDSEVTLLILLIFIIFVPLILPNMLPEDEDALA